MMHNNRGYLLIESIIALGITGLIIITGLILLSHSTKTWNSGEDNLDVNFNYRYTLNKLVEEIRDSCGVEILDYSDKGWIKVYKSVDKNKFITFKNKKNKLFLGYNNTLNSNSEFSNYVEKFKIRYLPLGIIKAENATGVRIYIQFLKDSKLIDEQISAAFRYK